MKMEIISSHKKTVENIPRKTRRKAISGNIFKLNRTTAAWKYEQSRTTKSKTFGENKRHLNLI